MMKIVATLLLLLLTACDEIDHRQVTQALTGTNPTGTVVWTNADDWTTVYTKIGDAMTDAGGGPVVVLVEPYAGMYQMEPAGAYDLSRVKFQGITAHAFTYVQIVDGVTWTSDSELGAVSFSSSGILWFPSCATTPLVTGGSVGLSIQNGGILESSNDARVFESLDFFQFHFQFATLRGTEEATNGMINTAFGMGQIFTGSVVEAGTFADAGNVGITADSSSVISASAGVTGTATIGYPHYP